MTVADRKNPLSASASAGDADEHDLLAHYGTGTAFFLASPRRALLATGLYATIADVRDGPPSAVGLPARTHALLNTAPHACGGNPVAVGAIPFDGGSPPWMFIPTVVQTAVPSDDINAGDDDGESAQPAPVEWCSRPSGADYERAVAAAVDRIRAGELSKVVLSRALEIELAVAPDRRALLRALMRANRDGYTFALDLPAPGAAPIHDATARTLLGASPELLISKEGDYVVANPLAGSTARGADAQTDRERAAALQQSLKDRHEHAVVVEAVREALQPFCRELYCPDEPELTSTQTLWYLSTRIEGRLADPTTSSLALGLALHPTPAVCGSPRDTARRTIAELEAAARGLFTGMIGWCDMTGDGEWVVTIRCAELAGKRLRLNAGAGIVAQSDPASERAETATKFTTMLHALGIDRMPEGA